MYLEILEDSDFYEIEFNQYFLTRFLNIQEIRGISPYDNRIESVSYEEPLNEIIYSGAWINTWNLKTIPKIIPYGTIIDA